MEMRTKSATKLPYITQVYHDFAVFFFFFWENRVCFQGQKGIYVYFLDVATLRKTSYLQKDCRYNREITVS